MDVAVGEQSVPSPGWERQGTALCRKGAAGVWAGRHPDRKAGCRQRVSGAGLRVGAKWGCPEGPQLEPVPHS